MLFPFLLGIAATIAVVAALRGRATANAPSSTPTGTGAVPPDSGTPTAAGETDVTIGTLAATLNAALHTAGSAASAPLVEQFQDAVGLSPNGQYDTSTARALAAYVSNPPAPDA